jgi:hypothetical protein
MSISSWNGRGVDHKQRPYLKEAMGFLREKEYYSQDGAWIDNVYILDLWTELGSVSAVRRYLLYNNESYIPDKKPTSWGIVKSIWLEVLFDYEWSKFKIQYTYREHGLELPDDYFRELCARFIVVYLRPSVHLKYIRKLGLWQEVEKVRKISKVQYGALSLKLR